MTVRILVTVSRSYREWHTMRNALEQTHAAHPDAVLVHGDCDPGDVHAAGMWKGLGGKDDPCPADWPTCAPDCKPGHRKVNRRGQEYCPTAGLRRDEVMVQSGPNLVIGFIDPKSRTKGAARTAQMAEDAGIPVVRYVQGEPGPVLANVAGDAA